eukprot:352494-Chlamydomonas_euryale.AAC.3
MQPLGPPSAVAQADSGMRPLGPTSAIAKAIAIAKARRLASGSSSSEQDGQVWWIARRKDLHIDLADLSELLGLSQALIAQAVAQSGSSQRNGRASFGEQLLPSSCLGSCCCCCAGPEGYLLPLLKRAGRLHVDGAALGAATAAAHGRVVAAWALRTSFCDALPTQRVHMHIGGSSANARRAGEEQAIVCAWKQLGKS